MKKKKSKQKYGWAGIVIIIILAVRVLAQLFMAMMSLDVINITMFYVIFFILYILSLYGVIIQKKWGYILTIIVMSIDILFLAFGGLEVIAGIAAAMIDIFALILSVLQLKN